MILASSSQNEISDSNRHSKAKDIEYRCCNKEANSPSSNDTVSGTSGIYYSVGADQGMGLKEKIKNVHGPNSRQIAFMGELEDFLSDGEEYRQATQKFKSYVRSRMKKYRDTDGLIDEFVNSGYIAALKQLCFPGSDKELDFYKDYAATYNMTLPQAILFGAKGTARGALKEYQKAEMLRGQHRGCHRPEDEQKARIYDNATVNTKGLPELENKDGDHKPIDLSDNKNKLPECSEGRIAHVFGREKVLCQTYGYKGTKRLSGDLPYQVLESMAIELLVKQNKQTRASSELEQIIEQANASGKDAFGELYRCIDKKVLRSVWDDARRILNDYAVNIWKKRNGFCETTIKMVEKKLPGTIYLNGSRYYWIPKKGEKTIPLIPEKDKNKLPGSLLRNEHGGYYWLMTHLKFRRRLVEPGQKVATKDLKTAQKLQFQEWERIQKYEPRLAARLKKRRKWGGATKHKPTAVKAAKRLWKQIQENDPDAVARILSDKRPEISRPDIDRVWPSWKEEKARLALTEDKTQLPILYPKQSLVNEWKYGLRVPEELETMVDKMKKVDWIKDNAMLVFDDNVPYASTQITKQSRGQDWTSQQSQEDNRYVIQGCTSIDRDSGRLKFTVYNPGYDSKKTLAEEIYHVVFGIIREADPKTLGSIQTWHRDNMKNGGDSTLNISEAFSQAMAEEELGHKSGLPQSVVENAQKVFSEKNIVTVEVMERVKKSW